MGAMASHITSLTIVCLLNRLFRRRSKKAAKLRVIGLFVGNSPHKWPVTRKIRPSNDVIMWRGVQAPNNDNSDGRSENVRMVD